MSVSVVILAAGAGTRMKSTLPKVLHKICGKEMLFYSIQEALKISDDIHIILFFEHKRIQDYVQNTFKNQLKHIHFHIQNHSKYPGTGGALIKDDLQNPIPTKYEQILILNGDMPLITKEQIEQLIVHKTLIAIGIFEISNPNGYGRVIIKDNQVKQIIEEKDANIDIKSIKTVNAGVYLFEKKVLQSYLPKVKNHNAQKEYYLTDLIQLAANDGIGITPVFVDRENFIGVNSKLELSIAQDLMLDRLRTRAMQQGVIIHLPHTVYLESDVIFEGECEIEQGVFINGETKIINSHIKAHSVIENSTIKNSKIGPMAHVRTNCYIDDTHIGNFVELKASELRGVKAGHLSYLGDCAIDKGSNVGAGVITCNYDGKTKHRTIIGKNVFIGSDSQLIAPIQIQSNVLIGSGTTVTKNAKEGDLVISRTKQENKTGGFYRFFKPNQSK
ncbi:bifunctional UDP-N-acetylglucosamine diphosphorylase/glucosamine-1-phosphate N-acetyltransferase GlmU [Helicobacter sp. 13S00477-4]|uniref:bifunctional UDP-N-acetylglucosamine diphosphorylase/glucosamine-1-phosphate N-acetyltransferase GlmU n=1 Tax=Helicobacter sp. 13S00477-4 TaxID=1905759 RepID=UPI000BA5F5D9|nr:bifunctional UDP-N-acetylglucosamine diphosphorylase/glucosamine-1-phosphate N-acetyltransferase GlmU [Helicobacter sp. 13S00477-4]PAF52235.1 UDP-N-acetylglucosamine diphosphorylase/glucosamine-1-phosphate N-acetyltransferase [Helicobacter sp. 13S00477-4]